MSRSVLILLLGSALGATSAAWAALPEITSADPPRFAGEAQLRPIDTVSADGRFALDAQLKPAAAVSTNGRFSLKAALRPDPKALAAVCGTDFLFSNGFEN